jgi:hypothetical protein
MTEELQLTLSRVTINAAASLLYRAWAAAYDSNKAVKAMKNDGSKDWAEFQVERLKNALAEEIAAKAALDEFTTQLPRGFFADGSN